MPHVGSLVAACMWDLVPRPGIEPVPPALGAQSPNHWTAREVPVNILKKIYLLQAWLPCLLYQSVLRVCRTPDTGVLVSSEEVMVPFTGKLWADVFYAPCRE